MQTVCNPQQCTACRACADICPKGAVSVRDDLFRNYAVIDESRCIGCDVCRKNCQVHHPVKLTAPILWKEGWSADENIRSRSSSGGAAAELAKAFIKDGGVVCSCLFDKGRFVFRMAETAEQAKAFAGSRYVKSNPSGAYKAVRKYLQKGRKVLFIGLPCQVAAMKLFTHDSPLLYTVDLICHGSPSPKVLRLFLGQSGINMKDLHDLHFRRDTHFQLSDRINGTLKALFRENVHDKYMISFLNCFTYTQNCYSCPYAGTERVSDITIGDSWGSELSDKEKKRGISLVLCQTEKGCELLEKTDMVLTDADPEKAKAHNQQLNAPAAEPENRGAFLKAISEGQSFSMLIRRYFPKKCFKQWAKSVLLKLSVIKE